MCWQVRCISTKLQPVHRAEYGNWTVPAILPLPLFHLHNCDAVNLLLAIVFLTLLSPSPYPMSTWQDYTVPFIGTQCAIATPEKHTGSWDLQIIHLNHVGSTRTRHRSYGKFGGYVGLCLPAAKLPAQVQILMQALWKKWKSGLFNDDVSICSIELNGRMADELEKIR